MNTSTTFVQAQREADNANKLATFDLKTLDTWEWRRYQELYQHSLKEECLQILINDVNGDYSELSPELAKLANDLDAE